MKKNVRVNYVTRRAFAKALTDIVFGEDLRKKSRNIANTVAEEVLTVSINSVTSILEPLYGKCAFCGLIRPLEYSVVLSNKSQRLACAAHFRISGEDQNGL